MSLAGMTECLIKWALRDCMSNHMFNYAFGEDRCMSTVSLITRGMLSCVFGKNRRLFDHMSSAQLCLR